MVFEREDLDEIFAVWNLEHAYFFFNTYKFVNNEEIKEDEDETKFFEWYKANILVKAISGVVENQTDAKGWIQEEIWKDQLIIEYNNIIKEIKIINRKNKKLKIN